MTTPALLTTLSTSSLEETEAFATLLSLARGKTLSIPPELLARHVLALSPDTDWPVQRAAMEALLRRAASARHEDLRVSRRPPGRRVWGLYATRRSGRADRPYRTVLESVDPIRGSCDCPDYLRGSLGLCKHLLVVLSESASSRQRWAHAHSARGASEVPRHLRLRWDPVRPLTGDGDWLGRVRLVGSEEWSIASATAERITRRWFGALRSGQRLLREARPNDPQTRARLVRDLLALLDENLAARRRPAWPADPALRALLLDEVDRLGRVAADRKDLPRLMKSLQSMRGALYPYQREGVERMLASGRLVLGDDMGLGKTIQAIACCHALWHARKVRRGLLVVPASLKAQWLSEWQQFSDAPVRVVEGGAPERRRTLKAAPSGFLIVNYEQVLRDLPALRAWTPELMVLDEAQRIKNWATKTAACVKGLKPHYRLILTGTPMENRLDELVSVVEWVDDHALEPKWRLAPWHSVYADGRKEVAGARNLDTLRLRLAPCLLRRRRQEVLRQLPPRTDTIVPVELTEEQRDAHDSLNQPIAQIVAIARRRPLTPAQFLKLMSLLTTQRIISNGLAQARFPDLWPDISRVRKPEPDFLRGLGSPKLLELREIISQVAVKQGRKVVVFSQWRRMLALAHWAVADVLAEGGVTSVFFTGQERQKQRTANIVSFHDDPDTRVFFATDAGGVGLNLQRAASCCINVELPWNPAVLEQRIGRIYRLGQKSPIDVYNLVGQDCIESRIAAIVSDKRALFSGLFDGASDQVRFERSGSFLNTIEAWVEKRADPVPSDGDGLPVDETGAVEAETEAAVAAADESQDSPLRSGEDAGAGPLGGSLPVAADLRRLFSGLRVERSATGGIRIEAPAETAESLVAVLEGLAQALRPPAGG